MTGYLAYAVGSPCPTLVLDSRGLPGERVLDFLTEIRRCLVEAGATHVLKIALVRPAEHPLFDLDYQFVQVLPGSVDSFDLRGSCGHSILAAVVAAERMGVGPRLTAGARVRVRVRNNSDNVVCAVDHVGFGETVFTVHFVPPDAVPVTELLIAGEPRTTLTVGGERCEVSMVSSGNPYVFVDARTLGFGDHGALFTADTALFERLTRIRAAAAELLGWPPGGAFPKIAAVMPGRAGELAVRAISVPSWHPTIALTGAVCVGSAVKIPGTVPWRVARDMGYSGGVIDIVTPGGRTAVAATVQDVDGVLALSWASVERKRVVFQGLLALEPKVQLRSVETAECLALSATYG